jgi:hypothetical protein
MATLFAVTESRNANISMESSVGRRFIVAYLVTDHQKSCSAVT